MCVLFVFIFVHLQLITANNHLSQPIGYSLLGNLFITLDNLLMYVRMLFVCAYILHACMHKCMHACVCGEQDIALW